MRGRLDEMAGKIDVRPDQFDDNGRRNNWPSFSGFIKIHGITHKLVAWHTIRNDGTFELSIRRCVRKKSKENYENNSGKLTEVPQTKNGLDMRGNLRVAGKEYQLIGWTKFSKGGNLSIQIICNFPHID